MSYACYTLSGHGQVPASGEDLGYILQKTAQDIVDAFDAPDSKRHYTCLIPAVQLFALAAGAYHDAAACSIGHNRTARYREQERALLRKVEELDTRVKKLSDENQARLKERLGF